MALQDAGGPLKIGVRSSGRLLFGLPLGDLGGHALTLGRGLAVFRAGDGLAARNNLPTRRHARACAGHTLPPNYPADAPPRCDIRREIKGTAIKAGASKALTISNGGGYRRV
jgi:hypothetical protein